MTHLHSAPGVALPAPDGRRLLLRDRSRSLRSLGHTYIRACCTPSHAAHPQGLGRLNTRFAVTHMPPYSSRREIWQTVHVGLVDAQRECDWQGRLRATQCASIGWSMRVTSAYDHAWLSCVAMAWDGAVSRCSLCCGEWWMKKTFRTSASEDSERWCQVGDSGGPWMQNRWNVLIVLPSWERKSACQGPGLRGYWRLLQAMTSNEDGGDAPKRQTKEWKKGGQSCERDSRGCSPNPMGFGKWNAQLLGIDPIRLRILPWGGEEGYAGLWAEHFDQIVAMKGAVARFYHHFLKHPLLKEGDLELSKI